MHTRNASSDTTGTNNTRGFILEVLFVCTRDAVLHPHLVAPRVKVGLMGPRIGNVQEVLLRTVTETSAIL